MENEFEIWVLSYATDLATRDLTGLNFSAAAGSPSANAMVASGITTSAIPGAESQPALASTIIDAATSTSPEGLAALAATDTLLVLYRFTATESGIASRATVGANAIFGTDNPDVIDATGITEEIYLRDGDDRFVGANGTDMVNGGPGDDTVTVTGPQGGYTLTLSAEGVAVTNRSDANSDMRLSDVETIEFADGSFDVDTFGGLGGLSGPDLAQFIELYIAYFNRAPDALGLGFWGTQFAKGTTLSKTAELFIDQDETRATYPETLTNTEFATAVYNNVLGRIPDQAGFDFWVGVLNAGSVSRDQFILEILIGAKAAPPVGADQAFIDQQLIDQKFLSDKTDLGAYFAVTLGMSNVANAASAMALFDGSQSSFGAAVAAIDGFFAAASDPNTGELLLPLVDVLPNPIPTQPNPGPQLPAFDVVDDAFTVTEDVAQQLNVLGNDTGSGLSIGTFTAPQNGTLELVQGNGGRLIYTPGEDFVGTDSFEYTTGDGFGQTGTGTVTITVEEDDQGNNRASPTPIPATGTIASELEDGFDVDYFSFDLGTIGAGAQLAFRLTGPSAAEAVIFLEDAGPAAVVAGGADDVIQFGADKSQGEVLVGVIRDGSSADVPGEDAYSVTVDVGFAPTDLATSEDTPMHVNLSGDGTWSTSDNTLSALAAIEEEGDRDWIGFIADASKTYQIDLTATGQDPTFDPDLIVRDSAGALIAQSLAFGSESFVFSPTGDSGFQQVYLEVFAFQSVQLPLVGTYDLTVTEIV